MKMNNLQKIFCNLDIEVLQSIYYLYEFTDDIIFLEQNTPSYPNIFNFVKTGILTEEEAYEALLYQNN